MSDHHVILRVVAKLLIPLITLYAFYVQFHGEYSPGGGFQAGVIFAVGIVLYALIFGVQTAMKAFPAGFTRGLAAVGVILYAGVGFWALIMGGNYLEYQVLFLEPYGSESHLGQHTGIILIELGVLFGVAGSILTIFFAVAGRVSDLSEDSW